VDVLVTYGSKMGGTAGIAEAIGDRLTRRGLTVEIIEAGQLGDVHRFDAIVLGSALYTGRWRPECVDLVRRLAKGSYPGPIWLFHSGPLGEDADEPQPLPGAVDSAARTLRVRDVATFAGWMPEHPKGFVARMMARNVAGDYRDWEAIDAWADGIADALTADRAA
jgi:menaquinone-dependent protoporphyrinogen oxidase